MKFGELKSIAHNISASLASGLGFLIGHYQTDIFGDALAAPESFIEVDFLAGEVIGGSAPHNLAAAIKAYRLGLAELCEKHGVAPSAFRELTTRYETHVAYGPRFTVTVEDQSGRRSTDRYIGYTGARRDAHLGKD